MMSDFYQNIPAQIDPVAISIGFFSVRWYSLMYLVAFVTVYLLLGWRIKRDNIGKQFAKNSKDFILDLLIYIAIGLILGARLGYVLFYDFAYYAAHPLAIISPYSAEGFTGIYGLSYFGGVIGVIMAAIIFCRKNKIAFWSLADLVLPAIPAGYFFGRIGNFLNSELFGRPTNGWWGMYFPSDQLGLLRHPSQLYEALLEGAALFVILWMIRNKTRWQGKLLWLYFLGYGLTRFVVEFVREPDPQLGLFFGYLSLGQIFAISMVLVGIVGTTRKKLDTQPDRRE